MGGIGAARRWLASRKFVDLEQEEAFQREFRKNALPSLQLSGLLLTIGFAFTFGLSVSQGNSSISVANLMRVAVALFGLTYAVFPFRFRHFWVIHYVSLAGAIVVVAASQPILFAFNSPLTPYSLQFPLSTWIVLIAAAVVLRVNRRALLIGVLYINGVLMFLTQIGILGGGKFFPWHFYVWLASALVVFAASSIESRERTLFLERLRAREAEKLAADESRSKSYFFSAASHDLRQPLAAMGLWAEHIGRAKTLEDAQKSAAALTPAIKSMREMFDALMLSSSLSAGRYTPELAPVELKPLIESLALEYQDRCALKGITLQVTTPDQITVMTDQIYLTRLLRNLLHNAVNYTERGSVRMGIHTVSPSHVEVFVADTGPGIDAEQQALIFEEYYQVPGSQMGKIKGLGLGLSIVKRISDALDLHLKLESSLGSGSRFSIHFQPGCGNSQFIPRNDL